MGRLQLPRFLLEKSLISTSCCIISGVKASPFMSFFRNQGLETFVELQGKYYLNLVRVFYSRVCYAEGV